MIQVRQLFEHSDLSQAVKLQKEIWGFADVELLPLRLFVVANKVGGHSFGAFDGDRMVGFCLAIPGIKKALSREQAAVPSGEGTPPARSGNQPLRHPLQDRSYLHSHMLGVLPDYRNRGVGRMLKLAQREEALSRGIELIEWTFDPLELKNAHFNINRLGAIVKRYVLNQYGITTSKLHGGLPTDRCVAEWWIASERVERALRDELPPPAEVLAHINIPREIGVMRTEDPAAAREIQRGVTEKFLEYLGQGLAVTGFERREREGVYLFEQWSD